MKRRSFSEEQIIGILKDEPDKQSIQWIDCPANEARRGKPEIIVSDNGTELTSNAVLKWTQDHCMQWRLHRAG